MHALDGQRRYEGEATVHVVSEGTAVLRDEAGDSSLQPHLRRVAIKAFRRGLATLFNLLETQI